MQTERFSEANKMADNWNFYCGRGSVSMGAHPSFHWLIATPQALSLSPAATTQPRHAATSPATNRPAAPQFPGYPGPGTRGQPSGLPASSAGLPIAEYPCDSRRVWAKDPATGTKFKLRAAAAGVAARAARAAAGTTSAAAAGTTSRNGKQVVTLSSSSSTSSSSASASTLLQQHASPPAAQQQQSPAPTAPSQPKVGECDPDFELRTCTTSQRNRQKYDVCNTILLVEGITTKPKGLKDNVRVQGYCSSMEGTRKKPSDSALGLCIGHSDLLWERMWKTMTSAQNFLDMSSLDVPNGR